MYDPQIERMTKDELLDRFFQWSSRQCIGQFARETDFYILDQKALLDTFRPMTEEELAERDAKRIARQKAKEEHQRAWEETLKAYAEERKAREEAIAAYTEEHGFSPFTVAAFIDTYPDKCWTRVSKRSGATLVCFNYRDKLYEVHPKEETQRLEGFDALSPNCVPPTTLSSEEKSESHCEPSCQ